MKYIKKSILEIKPYVPGASKTSGNAPVIKLSSNENALGCSAKAKDAYLKASEQLFRYPDGASNDLRLAIAKLNNLAADNIICGAGSDEIFSMIISALTREGDEIIYTEHGFLMYKIYALANGVDAIAAKEKNLTASIANILEKVTAKTRIVFIANPNNPTGSYLTRSELIDLREKLPEDIFLVIDGAYAEFADAEDYSSGLDLAKEYPNIIATRTFSKIYGLAALRLGWGYCKDEKIIDILNRVRGPFNVTTAAQQAGIAAIKDQEFVESSRQHNQKWLAEFAKRLTLLGIKFYPSLGNFILIEFSELKVVEVEKLLLENNIIVRNMQAYKLPNCLRVSIGTDIENEKFLEIITKIY
jgi:histidinol-phosphate aminotransferase